MNEPHVLIDASNLRTGGGVQVAASFVDELAKLETDPSIRGAYPWIQGITITVSSCVAAALHEPTSGLRVVVSDRYPLNRTHWAVRPKYDLAFTIFGPLYRPKLGRVQVVGFADGTSLFTLPPESTPTHLRGKIAHAMRKSVSKKLFRAADHIVVEADHVRDALVGKWGIEGSRIDVVPNCVNGIFSQPVRRAEETSRWCYVTRAYAHKNVDFLGKVGEELEKRGVQDVKFVLTLTPEEWRTLRPETRQHAVNLGPVGLHELPDVYASCEGAVFPSLLESFSVTPLEAMCTSTPLIASNRPFVRDICGEGAIYEDPRDASAWAEAIIEVRTNPQVRLSLKRRAASISHALPGPRQRALNYLDIIDKNLRHLADR